ncbi:MAG: SAM-dependent methyltransferase, partial [Gammaproteobacteria bacterium]
VGVVIANEVIDALPVTVFECRDGGIFERGVCFERASGLQWATRSAGAALACAVEARVTEPVRASHILYRSEINFRQATWLADLARFLSSGVVILADYGYPGHEYYHADRRDGTLQCHYRHRVHNDVFWHPGLQDITASVDFTALAGAATSAGFEVRGYADQANYLLSSGITDSLAEQVLRGIDAQYRAAQAVKTLLLPQAMGTRAKFMSLSVNYGGPITGYLLRDDRHRL